MPCAVQWGAFLVSHGMNPLPSEGVVIESGRTIHPATLEGEFARSVTTVGLDLAKPVFARIWLAAGFTDLRRGFDGLARRPLPPTAGIEGGDVQGACRQWRLQ